jgi:hypothetical protein
LDYGDELYEQFEVPWFSFRGNSKKYNKPWHWNDCIVSFEKISNEKIRFFIRRKKTIHLPSNTKLRWDEKQNSPSSNKKDFVLHYILHFDVKISELPDKVFEDKIEEQLYNKEEYGDFKDSWILDLDSRHRIWTWKDNEKETKIIMINILESINIKRNTQPICSSRVTRNSNINKNILPVVYHPSKDYKYARNYIQEIHLNRSISDERILVTIVYNDEQLRENKIVDGIYRIIRKLIYGRTFDVESFSIIVDKSGHARKFNFPDIYSGDNNNIEKDNIHIDKFDVDIQFYFNHNISMPILFVNTSNHAMAEKDNNWDKWKIEFRPWEEQCPIYLGQNTRCEIERYLSKNGLRNLIHKCHDSNY